MFDSCWKKLEESLKAAGKVELVRCSVHAVWQLHSL